MEVFREHSVKKSMANTLTKITYFALATKNVSEKCVRDIRTIGKYY